MTRARRASRGRVVVVAVATLGALALAACGIPNDNNFRTVDPALIPPGLVDPSTTTSSTTTTTIPVSTTVPASTTTLPNEAVSLYFLLGDLLMPVERRLPKGLTLEDVVRILSAGPILEEDLALRSALQFGTTGRVIEQGGVATVALEPTFADAAASEQRLALAQLVYTLTSRPGIGQVRFTVDGRTVAVPRPDGSLQSRPASKEDFSTLVLAPSTTTTLVVPEGPGGTTSTTRADDPSAAPV